MGLLDQLAGQAVSALGGASQEAGPQGGLMGSVMGLVNSAGGLPALIQQFQASGMGDQVASWIGHGENQAVSGQQIKDALGDDKVAEIATQAGVSPDHAAGGLAQLLPQIIDQLTPGGHVPENAIVQQGLNMLKGKMFG